MRVFLLKFHLAVVIATSLAACATPGSKPIADGNTSHPVQKTEASTGLLPGEKVDYFGDRCGNPNVHVKRLCIFPRHVEPVALE
jgi:hypothetical protein